MNYNSLDENSIPIPQPDNLNIELMEHQKRAIHGMLEIEKNGYIDIIDYLLENIIGLTIDGKMPNGKAGLAQELVTLKYLDSKSYLADVPVGVQNLLMNTVAPIARLFGKRAIYKKYSDIEK